mmetsp:Transcript_77892/g.167090  ORF Transcript_77892/g.167090 Transcript_77892/m.167090 type:complete len:250 (+) Transcript_77892:537-1286(+)
MIAAGWHAPCVPASSLTVARSSPWHCCQKASMQRRLKKSPLAITGMETALQSDIASDQWAGLFLCRSSDEVRRCTATASAPLRSMSWRKSRVLAIVGNMRILQDTEHVAGNSRRRDLMMSAATSGFSRSAAPMPPCALKGAVQPMLTSIPRTSLQTWRAACVANAASAVPTWKMLRPRSSSQVLYTTLFSRAETKSVHPNAGFSTRTVSRILRSISTPLYTSPAPCCKQQSRSGNCEARTMGERISRPL